MHLVSRQVSEADHESVVRLYSRCGYPRISDESWRDVWTHGHTFGIALEDRLRSPSDRVLAVALATFVSDLAFHDLRRSPLADPASALPAMCGGGKSPYLNIHQIAAGNASSGLNMLISHAAWTDHDRGDLEQFSLRAIMLSTFADRHAGHRLKSLALACPNRLALETAVRLGFAPHGENRGSSEVPLVSISKPDGLRSGDCWLARMFTYLPPRFHFTASQRQILLLARDGYTDAEIAEIVRIKPDAVKKRWLSIYPRVSRILPELLPISGLSGRGAEKRRVLLMHLRARPEELRPYARIGSRRSQG